MTDLLTPGQLFAGRYRVERPLARGGMGAVFVATHLETEGRVALKVLLPHIVHNERARERFRQEARFAAQMRSEHIVRVHDAGLDRTTNMPFLAMELLEGHSLFEEVTRSGVCTRRETVAYMRQVAAGLDRAHGFIDTNGVPRPVVHRDLKPDNLFLTRRDDGEPLVKILDFGLAKVASHNAELSYEVKGTPEYMAFEQLRGEPVSPQTDVWPLGLIAFFLLSGRSYWLTASTPDSNVQALFAELLAPHKPPPSERIRQLDVEPTWPRAFDPWFLRCVSPDPVRRFASAGEAVRALEEALLVQGESAAVRLPRPAPAVTVQTSPDAQPTLTLDSSSSRPVQTRAARPAPAAPVASDVRDANRQGSGAMPPMRARDAARGFDVRIVPERRVLRLQCWGNWDDTLASHYTKAVRSGMRKLTGGGPWYVLADISRYPAQRPPVAAVHGMLMAEATELGMVRACGVVHSALTQMQMGRLAQESGMPELTFFKDERTALDWVTRPDPGPDGEGGAS